MISLTVALETGETSSRQQTSKISRYRQCRVPDLAKNARTGQPLRGITREVKSRATLSPKNAKGWGTRQLRSGKPVWVWSCSEELVFGAHGTHGGPPESRIAARISDLPASARHFELETLNSPSGSSQPESRRIERASMHILIRSSRPTWRGKECVD